MPNAVYSKSQVQRILDSVAEFQKTGLRIGNKHIESTITQELLFGLTEPKIFRQQHDLSDNTASENFVCRS